MRISDWTDVCSSDPDGSSRPRTGGGWPRTSARKWFPVRAKSDRDASRARDRRGDRCHRKTHGAHSPPVNRGRLRERRLSRAGDACLRTLRDGRRWAWLPARTLAPRTRAASRPPRSEEHTSELQSLMRNSYAVFCLKKKKKKSKKS